MQVGYLLDANNSVLAAYQLGRTGGPLQRLGDQFQAWYAGTNLAPVMVFDQRIGQAFLTELAKQVDRPVIEAGLGLQGAEVQVNSGQVGRTLDVNATLELVGVQAQTLRDGVIPLFIRESAPMIIDASAQAEVARRMLSESLTLSIPDTQSGDPGPWVFEPQTLAGMLSIERVSSPDGSAYQVVLNSSVLTDYLTNLAPSLERQPVNTRFTFNDETKQLEVIAPAVIGRSLDVTASVQAINEKLTQGEHNIPLVFQTVKPAVTDDMTAEQLGIRELVRSESTYFRGSSAARVQNITTAASRFHGVLVAPGETFSMASTMGDVSLDTGYAEALIIYGDRTIQGVGGGVCQVSTTLFRTVFFAGFPVEERHAHAYRVSYYEQKAGSGIDPQLAGLDATVFVPLVDFKFTNDTPYWLLMETYMNGASLTWKFYSTSDGRSVEWHTSGLTNIVEPGEPVYSENPELPQGEIKQIDWAVAGADINITRTVYRDGSAILQDSFQTHYLPWQDAYEYGPGTELPTPEP
jgi:vancomycin resistance protein YoaR